MLFQLSRSNYSCIVVVVGHMLGNTTERAARANSALLGRLGRDVSWGNNDCTIFILVIYFNLNSVSHVLVRRLVASPVADSLCWLEVLILLSDNFITENYFTALLVFWGILKKISIADIRLRSFKVNCFSLALLEISGCEVSGLEEDFAVFVLAR